MSSLNQSKSLVLLQAPPKEVPKTIENQRVYDETTVDPADEEVWIRTSAQPRLLFLVLLFQVFAVINRLHLMRELMSFRLTLTG